MVRVRAVTPAASRAASGADPLFRRLARLPDAIKFQESLFALPFAYAGMFLAASGLPTLAQFLWISAAMIGARTLGMAANRLLDRHIDAINPRVSDRHLPSGRVHGVEMAALAAAGLALLTVSAWQLNTLALSLVPVAAAYLLLYPLAKRHSFLANPLLGWALAMAPAAAWIGVRGSLGWEPVALALGVALWAGSFDIVYHVQDYDFHKERGLHSVAARFGIRPAFAIARTMDIAAVAVLIALGLAMGLAWPYFLGVSAAAAGLLAKHMMVGPDDVSRMGVAFFRINSFVSLAMLGGTLGAVLV